MSEQKEQQISIDIKRTLPLFADNVLVAKMIKKEGKKKEGFLTLVFIDGLTKQAVARIVISKHTAESMLKILDNSLKNFNKELKSKQSKTDAEKIKRYLG